MQDIGLLSWLRPGVVPLSAHPARLGQAMFAQVEAYWTALCEGGLPPLRSQIDPRGIESALNHAFILERITQGEARLRVGGQSVGDLLGMEPRGMPFSALIEPAARGSMQDIMGHLFDDPALCRVTLASPGGIGRRPLTARVLLLPLRDETGAMTRALGCLVISDHAGRAPRRFDITDSRIAAITGAGSVVATPPCPAPQPQPGMAEGTRDFSMPSASPVHSRARLRLVKSD